jgi:two-component system response regulator
MPGNEVEILLVEDDPDEAELTLHAFEADLLASRVQVAADGEEALDFVFCRGPFAGRDPHWPLKLILLDLKLPKLDGLEVLRRLKSDAGTRTIPVVLLTSSKEESDRREGYLLGANSFVQKPVDFESFRATVKQLGRYWLLTNQPPPAPAAVAGSAFMQTAAPVGPPVPAAVGGSAGHGNNGAG